MKTMRDAAFPNDSGPETDIMFVYVGGDTPHPWSNADIASMDERYLMPAWVRSNPSQFSGAAEAATFAAWLHSRNVTPGSTVCLDLETAADVAYVNAFNMGIRASGFKVLKYGSRSAIFNNPKTDGGTFIADPTGTAHMIQEGDCVATQYAFDGQYDLSLVLDSVPLWDTKPKPPPPPPTGVLDSGPVPLPGYADSGVYFNVNDGTLGYRNTGGLYVKAHLPRGA